MVTTANVAVAAIYCLLCVSSAAAVASPSALDGSAVEKIAPPSEEVIEAANQCSRERSRRVRHFVQHTVLNKFVNSFRMSLSDLPQSCQLNPKYDLYLEHEKHKQRVGGDWQCSLCSKIFKSEFYLDKHMMRRHPEFLAGPRAAMASNATTDAVHASTGRDTSSMSVCLGDFCPLFGCQLYVKSTSSSSFSSQDASSSGLHAYHIPSSSSKSGRASLVAGYESPFAAGRAASFSDVHTCTAEEVERLRNECHELMGGCFSEWPKMQEYAEASVCRLIHCENGLLKGLMPSSGSVSASTGITGTDEDEAQSSLWIIQMVVLIMGAVVFATYAMFGESAPFLAFGGGPGDVIATGSRRGGSARAASGGVGGDAAARAASIRQRRQQMLHYDPASEGADEPSDEATGGRGAVGGVVGGRSNNSKATVMAGSTMSKWLHSAFKKTQH